jgi:DnaJ-class molecular chaperone
MRQGNDLIWNPKISFVDSVNGKNISIPHFDGSIDINTSDWGVIDPREDYIIPGKGFKGGKLRVMFNVIYPKKRFVLTEV